MLGTGHLPTKGPDGSSGAQGKELPVSCRDFLSTSKGLFFLLSPTKDDGEG